MVKLYEKKNKGPITFHWERFRDEDGVWTNNIVDNYGRTWSGYTADNGRFKLMWYKRGKLYHTDAFQAERACWRRAKKLLKAKSKEYLEASQSIIRYEHKTRDNEYMKRRYEESGTPYPEYGDNNDLL